MKFQHLKLPDMGKMEKRQMWERTKIAKIKRQNLSQLIWKLRGYWEEGIFQDDWVWNYGKEKVQKDEDKLSFNNILEESVRYIDSRQMTMTQKSLKFKMFKLTS